jgi:predicted CXXCH cytochrome family protein
MMKEDPSTVTHAPFESGDCTTCHDVHASGHSGMIAAAQEKLCLECHSDLGDGAAKAKSTHEAFSGGQCSKCHSPHRAKLPKLILAPEPDLCTSCHSELGERLRTENAHSPASGDCSTCHAPHFSSETRLLTERQQSLCATCHDVKAADFSKVHIGIDPAVMNCVKCHEPHASKDPKLFKAEVHAPFAARSCEECHVVKP